MSSPSGSGQGDGSHDSKNYDPNPPTVAAFSPETLSSPSTKRLRSNVLVQRKSPLLAATPPQITRTLAYSHPFLLPATKLVGLLSWTSGDPWESFLLVAGFWGMVLYGDILTRWLGPVLVVLGLIIGMWSRRYSPLSTNGFMSSSSDKGKGHKRDPSEGNMKHQKSLDEIVETLKLFTSRCNVLLEPLLHLTDFLSTQRTATSATTRPALTTLFIRILLVTPLWVALTLPPLRIITTRRVVLAVGTIMLTYHSRPARVSRVILWRSLFVRQICSSLTGLTFGHFDGHAAPPQQARTTKAPPLPPRRNTDGFGQGHAVADSIGTKRRPESAGVKFTFILFENQRRWLGVGWTYSLFAYERAAWTDEHLNPAPSKEEFELPEAEAGNSRWRWVAGSEWRVEGAAMGEEGGAKVGSNELKGTPGGGWIYYDNKWRDGKRGVDSWGRYTRRRKWYRDAELVEVTPSTEITPASTPNPKMNDAAALSESEITPRRKKDRTPDITAAHSADDADAASNNSSSKRGKGWFKRRDRGSSSVSRKSLGEDLRPDSPAPSSGDEDPQFTMKRREGAASEGWGVGEDAGMLLS